MAEIAVNRRLAAIFAADVVGYSRLMGANEVATLAALKSHRATLVDNKIAEHQGRIVKLTGDGMLVEFSSVVNAVACAVEIQAAMRERNVEVPADRRIEFRIGINLGDIIVEDGDIYGDGVNLAARIESIANPGGVAVSAAVRENIGKRLDLHFEDMGERVLKNIDRTVRVFSVVSNSFAAAHRLDASLNATPNLSGRPSIAVLPFTNMSGDPEQEYFSDGITEDIITDLTQISGLFVVGRNSVFTYKGKSVRLEQVAKELGVGFLLEGSVRKVGQRVRISGQLVDGTSGGHLWASRYDRDLTDIFAVQDEIAHTIVEQLKVHLLPDERRAIAREPTKNVEAYTYYLRGRQLFFVRTKSALLQARRMFSRALELDPLYARAYAGMADCDSYLCAWFGARIPSEDILSTTDKALAIDSALSEAHAARGFALLNDSRREEAAIAFERSLQLNRDCYEANYYYARYCFSSGDLDKAAKYYIRALEIQPDDYKSPCLLQGVFRTLGRDADSLRYAHLGIKRAEEAFARQPDGLDPAALGAATLAAIGEPERAKEWLARALAISEDPSDSWYNIACTYALIGEFEKAIDLLELCLPQTGPEELLWMQQDHDLDPIRDHPRFRKLFQQAR